MATEPLQVIADFPPKLEFLFKPARYKVAWGGRGGSKSWNFARALLIQGIQRPLRILCARETMQSIADSVHQLLKDQIDLMQLHAAYTVQKTSIIGTNGTQFAFAGLRHNVNQIKSYEAFDIAWVEEAQSVSRASWQVLIPTIRQKDSEIWVSFNPNLESDDTYQRFILHPPPGCEPVKLSWRDNPWFPDVLRVEMEHLKSVDEDAYNHVWEGCCVTMVEGAIYTTELRQMDREQRVMRVPYDATMPVHTYWDLGFADETAIWFIQNIGYEYRVIDYEEGSRLPLKHYQKRLQDRPYVYGIHHLPHDAKAKQLGSGRSIEELMRAAGFNIRIVRKLSVIDGINAVRTIFPQCYFDSDKCADGLSALRHYRWSPVGVDGQIKRMPLHDWASNGADAFRTFAVGVRPERKTAPRAETPRPYISAWS